MDYNLKNRVVIEEPFPDYDKALKFDISMRKRTLIPYSKAAKRIVNVCKPGDKIIQIGMVTGLIPLYLAGRLKDVEIHGVEENEYCYEVANDNLDFTNWVSASIDVEFIHCKLDEVPYQDKSFDVVFSYAAMRYWKDPEKVLREYERICKPEGIIILEDHDRLVDALFLKNFINLYINKGTEFFLESLRASFSKDEVLNLLKKVSGNREWFVIKDDINLVYSSKKL